MTPRCASVILTGCATNVPFTAVLNGLRRTTTDNHEAASTCAIPDPRRPPQRPNWLWEHGVAPLSVLGRGAALTVSYKPALDDGLAVSDLSTDLHTWRP
jgi:hypothetical protein